MLLGTSALIVFAREPRLRKVKTRLQAHLPADTVLKIYEKFLRHVLDMASQVRCDHRWIFYTGAAKPDFLRRFQKKFVLRRQKGADLGARMLSAFRYAQKQEANKTVIIGTDCLTLRTEDIAEAFQKLSTHDCVLGPAKDGGYYLIGLKKPRPELFSKISWSSSEVLHQTIHKIQKIGYSYDLLKQQEDIDTLEDLQHHAFLK